MKHLLFKGLLPLLLLTASLATAQAADHSVPVEAKDGNKTLKGTLFLPAHPAGALPLVVVVHEWWGKTDYPDLRARRIADELGYAALSVDLYGEGKTASTPDAAQALAKPFYGDPELGVRRQVELVQSALSAAKAAGQPINPGEIAAIGYCFGGTQVLNLARSGQLEGKGDHLLGVVSFHGGLSSSLKASEPIKSRLLVLSGAADKMVPPEQVAAFKNEMKKDKANLDFHAYPGALHAFTNPEATAIGEKYHIPIAYNAAADKDSWARMTQFLKGLFAG